MTGKFLCSLLLCTASIASYAQQQPPNYCATAKQQHRTTTAQRGTVADAREENYDVKYVKLDLALTNNDASISGNAFTQAITTTAMSNYVFELTADLTIDSVKVNGQIRAFTHPGEIGVAALTASIPANTSFNAQVFYHGTIANGSGFFDRGLRNVYSGAAQRQYTFTLGEAYTVKDWWPCKQALQDKIDSSDVWVTVPDTLKAGSNGLLQQITTLSGSRKRYEWKNRNPIDYYLISASVGNYIDYSYYMHFDNSTDSMLMQNYMYPNALAQRKAVLDSTALMINYFSTLFGRYPFWKEKYGHCQAPLSGGEEHQTMTTLGVFDNEVVPHELAHQWFGDHVTCATWKDIWLNEGFASYAEYLHVQHFNGATAAKDKIAAVHYDAMHEFNTPAADPSGTVYVDDTTSEDRIFSSRLTYNRGSSVIHTLRFEANNDTLFFNLLRTYQQQYANGTATTEQFKNLAAQQYGRNMDTFFTQWIYNSGWPIYNATWNQSNGVAFIRLNQNSTGSQNVYSTPLEIKLSGPQGDTTVRLYVHNAVSSYSISWSKPVTGIVIDPNDWLLDEPGSIARDNTLSLHSLAKNEATIYPNPVHDFLNLKGVNKGLLQITDVTGKLLINYSVQGNEPVDVRLLTPGLYLYRIVDQGAIMGQGKLLKE